MTVSKTIAPLPRQQLNIFSLSYMSLGIVCSLLFCPCSYLASWHPLLTVNHFYKKVPSQMFHRILNTVTSTKLTRQSSCILTETCIDNF